MGFVRAGRQKGEAIEPERRSRRADSRDRAEKPCCLACHWREPARAREKRRRVARQPRARAAVGGAAADGAGLLSQGVCGARARAPPPGSLDRRLPRRARCCVEPQRGRERERKERTEGQPLSLPLPPLRLSSPPRARLRGLSRLATKPASSRIARRCRWCPCWSQHAPGSRSP
jgi:hypothetical protein